MFGNTKKIALLSLCSLALASTLFTACQNPCSQGCSCSAARKVTNINAKTSAALLARDPSVVVLDIRTPKEFAEGHIKGAKNVDFKSAGFDSALSKLDKSKTYLMHCRSGGRSGRALPAFKKQNFSKIYHLDHGFNEWKASGLPVAK